MKRRGTKSVPFNIWVEFVDAIRKPFQLKLHVLLDRFNIIFMNYTCSLIPRESQSGLKWSVAVDESPYNKRAKPRLQHDLTAFQPRLQPAPVAECHSTDRRAQGLALTPTDNFPHISRHQLGHLCLRWANTCPRLRRLVFNPMEITTGDGRLFVCYGWVC